MIQRPPPMLLFLNRRVIGSLHDGDAAERISPVVITFGRVRDRAAIRSNVAPAPVASGVSVETVMHWRILMDKFKTFLVSYRHDGSQWNIELPATDIEDARQRLSQLVLGRLEGEIIADIPGALGPLAALAAFTRNLFVKRADSAV